MARIVTLHFSDAQAKRLERFARDRHADLAETGVRLIDEALRSADHPDIEFRDSVVGRQAYMRGSTLAVWEVVMLARERKNDADSTAAYLGWQAARVQAALNYAATYPQEIDVALRENDTFDVEKVRHLLPEVRVIDIALADTP